MAEGAAPVPERRQPADARDVLFRWAVNHREDVEASPGDWRKVLKCPRRYDPEVLAYAQAVQDAVWERIHSYAAWWHAGPIDDEEQGVAAPFAWGWREEDMGLPERPDGVRGYVFPIPGRPIRDYLYGRGHFYGMEEWRWNRGSWSAWVEYSRSLCDTYDIADRERAVLDSWPWSEANPYVPPPGCRCETCVRLREEAV